MSNTGTNEAERGLNVPKSEEELADLVLTAVSEGNTEEMERLFSVELSPDVADEEEEDSNEDPSADASDEEDSGKTDSQTEDGSTKDTDLPTQQTPAPTAEERLAQLEKRLNDANAAVGRTAALQSRLARLERELKEAKANKPEEPSAEEKELDERIARLKEIDPDTAAILETLKKQNHSNKAKPQTETADDDAIREEYYKVLEVHSDADKIFNHPYWHQWKSQLTRDQREWAESADSQKVIAALGAFKEFMNGYPSQQQAPAAAVVEEVVDETKLKREKKLMRSADSSDIPVKASPKFDEAAFFEEAYAAAAKEAGISY